LDDIEVHVVSILGVSIHLQGAHISAGQNNCKSPMDLTFRKKTPRGALQLAQKLSKQNLKGQVERTSPKASSRGFFQRTLWQTVFVP
jgi:hypothetical protein